MNLLVHTCCGPYAVQCVARLREDGIAPTLYWYNPNIHPWTEYTARLGALEQYAAMEGLSLVREGAYGLRPFLAEVWPDIAARCAHCYRMRLQAAASYAATNGFDAYTTTLLISPYQNHDLLWATGEELARTYGVDFYYRDFRPQFREGQRMAREKGLYMQKYCGCIFSEEERYQPSLR